MREKSPPAFLRGWAFFGSEKRSEKEKRKVVEVYRSSSGLLFEDWDALPLK